MSAAVRGSPVTTMTVIGTSMLPLLRTGQRVGVFPMPPGEIRVGDIVAFRSKGRVILHRIIGRATEGGRMTFREKGDNKPLSTFIDESQCIGRAAWVEALTSHRQLDVVPGPGLRLLTWLSRTEAAVFDGLRGWWIRVFGPARPRAAIHMLRAIRVVLLPARMLAAPLLFHVYPVDHGGSGMREGALLDLVRLVLGPADVPAAVPQSDVWPGILEAANGHGVESIVVDGLVARGELPEELAGDAKTQRYRGVLNHVAAVSTLLDAQRALSEKSIAFAVLKGPPLAAELYADPSLRLSADLDLLVRHEDIDAAVAALAEAGYRVHGSAASRRLARRIHFHLVMEPPPGKRHLKVELHWDLVDRANLYRVDARGVFARLRDAEVDGSPVPVPGREDGLIYLCLHAAKHGLFNARALEAGAPASWYCRRASGNRLVWFVDVHLYLAKHAHVLDWAEVRERCSEWNVTDDVTVTLRILDLLLPDSHAARALEAMGHARREHPAAATGAARHDPRRDAFLNRLLEAGNGLVIRPARLLTFGRELFPSPERMMRYYGSNRRVALPFLYAWHPFHMLRRIVATRA
ncbi:MAG: nucleotidyltransferase family protein [bacterium]